MTHFRVPMPRRSGHPEQQARSVLVAASFALLLAAPAFLFGCPSRPGPEPAAGGPLGSASAAASAEPAAAGECQGPGTVRHADGCVLAPEAAWELRPSSVKVGAGSNLYAGLDLCLRSPSSDESTCWKLPAKEGDSIVAGAELVWNDAAAKPFVATTAELTGLEPMTMGFDRGDMRAAARRTIADEALFADGVIIDHVDGHEVRFAITPSSRHPTATHGRAPIEGTRKPLFAKPGSDAQVAAIAKAAHTIDAGLSGYRREKKAGGSHTAHEAHVLSFYGEGDALLKAVWGVPYNPPSGYKELYIQDGKIILEYNFLFGAFEGGEEVAGRTGEIWIYYEGDDVLRVEQRTFEEATPERQKEALGEIAEGHRLDSKMMATKGHPFRVGGEAYPE